MTLNHGETLIVAELLEIGSGPLDVAEQNRNRGSNSFGLLFARVLIRDQLFDLVRFHYSPFRMPPRLPSIEPCSRLLPLRPGTAAIIRFAIRLSGSDCSQTRPGPRSVAKNNPSPHFARSEEHTSELQSP